MLQRLGGRAEYADRVTLGPIELIVRDVDENGRIVSVGLSLEPTPASPHSGLPQRRANCRPPPRTFSSGLRGAKTWASPRRTTPDSYNSRGH